MPTVSDDREEGTGRQSELYLHSTVKEAAAARGQEAVGAQDRLLEQQPDVHVQWDTCLLFRCCSMCR